jgi:subtilisin family serine protease
MDDERKPVAGGQPDYRHKLDGALRTLLEMDETTIRERIRQDDQRLQRLRERIIREVERDLPGELARRAEGKPPQQPSTSGVEALRAEMLRLRRGELVPDSILAVVRRDLLPELHVRAITTFTGNRTDLEALGLQVGSQAQDVFTVVGTPQQLRDLAAQPACRNLRAPRVFFPVVENASAQAQIAAVHLPHLPQNPHGYEGNGILVGIIDSALDVTHRTFRDPGGTNGTRLLYYWVQVPYDTFDAFFEPDPLTGVALTNLPGQDPAAWSAAGAAGTRPDFTGLNFGRLYTQADINNAITSATHYGTGNNRICCRPEYRIDASGNLHSEHGTHCAGIAAGNGREANGTAGAHIGAAPQATIIYVCTDRTEDHILQAISFILTAAGTPNNLPVVISISLGSFAGPHNGTTNYDHAIDHHLDSHFNRSVVIAAGNDNNKQAHLAGTIAAGSTTSFTWTDATSGGFLDIWYDGPELDYCITHGTTSNYRTAGQDYSGSLGGEAVVATRSAPPGSGLSNILIEFQGAVRGDAYTIDLRNPHANQPAGFHAWTEGNEWAASLAPFTRDATTLSDDACGNSVLTLGAALKVTPAANPATGELTRDSSGAGPTLDGRIKPEIIAVGDSVVSAASDQGNGWTTMSGTSMAAPLAAGAVALLLEAYTSAPLNLRLNQDTIKALLTQHTNTLSLNLDPNQAGYQALQRNLYGYGRLRMQTPIDLTQATPGVDVWVRTAGDDWGKRPYTGDCFCSAPDIRVCQANTDTLATEIHWNTRYDVKVTVRNLGDANATATTVTLKYTLPWTAPTSWFEAEDAGGGKLHKNVDINAMDQREVVFQWTPKQGDHPTAPADQTHFCLLAELDQASDHPVYQQPSTAGATAWSKNICGTNNVALHNLNILQP